MDLQHRCDPGPEVLVGTLPGRHRRTTPSRSTSAGAGVGVVLTSKVTKFSELIGDVIQSGVGRDVAVSSGRSDDDQTAIVDLLMKPLQNRTPLLAVAAPVRPKEEQRRLSLDDFIERPSRTDKAVLGRELRLTSALLSPSRTKPTSPLRRPAVSPSVASPTPAKPLGTQPTLP